MPPLSTLQVRQSKVSGKGSNIGERIDQAQKQGAEIFIISDELPDMDKVCARRFLERAIGQHGLPDKSTIDKSGANTAGVHSI